MVNKTSKRRKINNRDKGNNNKGNNNNTVNKSNNIKNLINNFSKLSIQNTSPNQLKVINNNTKKNRKPSPNTVNNFENRGEAAEEPRDEVKLKLVSNKSGYKKLYRLKTKNNNNHPTNITSYSAPNINLGPNPLLLLLNANAPHRKNKNANNNTRRRKMKNRLNRELKLQSQFASMSTKRSPIVSNYVETNHPGSTLSYYVEGMKTFKEIFHLYRGATEYLKSLYKSFLESVSDIFLNTGYINIDMKEENLVIDERDGLDYPNVLLIDTDPKFFINIADSDERKLMAKDKSRFGHSSLLEDYNINVKLSMLIMILFNAYPNIGSQRHPRVLQILAGRAKDFKCRYFTTEFCRSNGITKVEDIYNRLKMINDKINEKLNRSTQDKDLNYMIFFYCIRDHPNYTGNRLFQVGENYINLLCQHIIAPIFEDYF